MSAGQDPEESGVISLLDDEYARAILVESSREPLSASALAERCDASEPTIYRRIEQLRDHDLIVEQQQLDPDGHHYKTYQTRVERVTVEIEDGAFTLLVSLGTTSLSLVFVPLYYEDVNVGVNPVSGEMSASPSIEFALQTWQIGLTIPFRVTTWYVTTLPEALAVSGFGLLAVICSLHVCNFAARVAGWYASLLLGGTDRSTIRRALDV